MFVATWAGSCLASCAAWVGCSALSCTSGAVMKTSARVAYCFLFTLSMILSWVMRDYGQPLLEKIPWIVKRYTGEPSDAFFGLQAVYRISLGNFLLFGTLSLVLLGVKYQNDNRAKFLMSGSPAIKFGLWFAFNVLPFFLPNSVVLAYGYIARICSVLFLFIQMLLLLDFVLSINESWVSAAEQDERHYKAMLGVTAGCYLACLALICFLFVWFKPPSAGPCSFNVAVITMSIFLFVGFTLVSISPLVRQGNLFPSAVMSVYCMYLAYSALQSEPHSEVCNGLGQKIDAASGTTLAVGMLVMLLSVVYSAFKAGSNTTTFTIDGGAAEESAEEPLTSAGLDGAPASQTMESGQGESSPTHRALDDYTPATYNYAFFHLVFALASTYMAMLLTGWGDGAEERGLMDIGWASVTMKLLTQWCTGLLYVWVLLAPAVCEDRDF